MTTAYEAQIRERLLRLEQEYMDRRRYLRNGLEMEQLHDYYHRTRDKLEKELHMEQRDVGRFLNEGISSVGLGGNHQNQAANNMLNAQMQNMLIGAPGNLPQGFGISQQNIAGGNNEVSPLKKAAIAFGVLLLGNKELPDDWRGARYDTFERIARAEYWELRFKSRWSNDTITVLLDNEETNGAQATAIGNTYLEAINQRRLG